jgi:hypothetical protein
MTVARRNSAAGFAMVAMMVVLALLGVFAVVSTRLIKTTLDLYREAGRIDGEARVMDLALERVRQDAWSARQVDVASPKSIAIERGAGGGAVQWRVEADGTLVREEGGAGAETARRWPGVGARLSFEWDGTALAVRGADRGADRAGGVRMPSQLKLAEAGGAR